jgi:hypothetical protein
MQSHGNDRDDIQESGESSKRKNGRMEGQKVEVVNEIVYLGVKLDCTG